MATLVGTQTDVSELLEQLILLDFDSVEAYDSAIVRLRDPERRAQLSAFRDDHVRHALELGKVLRESGREPPHGAGLKRMLTQSKVVLAGMAGDRAVLKAMKSNEDDTNVAYERAASSDLATPRLKELLRACLADERRHRAWIEEELEDSEPPMPMPGES